MAAVSNAATFALAATAAAAVVQALEAVAAVIYYNSHLEYLSNESKARREWTSTDLV